MSVRIDGIVFLRRDAFDKEIEVFLIGEAIKKTRLQQNFTQKQLGELVGVKNAQISKIESGKSVTWSTIVKVFKAMETDSGVLDLGEMGRGGIMVIKLNYK